MGIKRYISWSIKIRKRRGMETIETFDNFEYINAQNANKNNFV